MHHVMQFTITLQEDTTEEEAKIIRSKTLTVLNHFMEFMAQPDCTVASTMEIN